jgi:integrase
MTMLDNYVTFEEWLKRKYANNLNTGNLAKSALKSYYKFIKNENEELLLDEMRKEDPFRGAKNYTFANRLVNHMCQTLDPATAKNYFNWIKDWWRSQGVYLEEKRLKSEVSFPKKLKENLEPLALSEIQEIISNADQKRKALYLTLASSGKRISELLYLRMMDVDWDSNPVSFKIRAGNTKAGQEHEGYFSSEALAAIKKITKDKKDEDFVFHNRTLPYNVKEKIQQYCWGVAEMKYFGNLRKRIGYNKKYLTGRNTKTIHNFRSFFFTWASLENGDGYAHAMTGHTAYLGQYFRLEKAVRIEKYLKLEPRLTIFENPKNIQKVKKLEIENKKIEDIQREMKKYRNVMERLKKQGLV